MPAPRDNLNGTMLTLGYPTIASPMIPTPGKSWFVDSVNGSDSNSGHNWKNAFASLQEAEEHCVANRGDVVYFIGSSSGITMTETLTWDKNYTHLVGLNAPTFMAQRSRIFHSANFSPGITLSASGCIFKNFYFSYGRGNAGNLIALTVSGSRNYLENVHIAGPQHATEAATATYHNLELTGSENLFKNCTIGNDTISVGTGIYSVNVDGAATRNKFENCLFPLYISNGGAMFINFKDTTSADRLQWFENCVFYSFSANHVTPMTTALTIPANHQTMTVLMRYCTFVGVSDIESSDRGHVFLDGAAPTNNTSGLAVANETT